MIGLGSKHIVNAFNLWVVVFVALGTLSTAYGLAIIGSTVGQPNCEYIFCFFARSLHLLRQASLRIF